MLLDDGVRFPDVVLRGPRRRVIVVEALPRPGRSRPPLTWAASPGRLSHTRQREVEPGTRADDATERRGDTRCARPRPV